MNTRIGKTAASIRKGPGKFEYPEQGRLVLALFCCYVLAWYLQFSYRWPVFQAVRFEFSLAAVLSAVAVFRVVGGVHRGSAPGYLRGWVTALFVTIVVALVASRDPATSWPIFIERVVEFSFMALFISVFVVTPRGLRWFLAAFILACLRLGYEGMVGFMTGSLVWENQGILRLHGPTPLYAHPNSFSGNALGALPFAICLFPHVGRWAKVLLLMQGVFSLNIVLRTGSRTGYVALAALAGFLVYRSKHRFRAMLITLAVAVACFVVLPDEYRARVYSIVTLEEKEGKSAETRIQILEDAWAVFVENPLGVGVKAFPAVRGARFGRFQDTHNLYLEVATNLGIQGLIAFVGFVAAMFLALARVSVRLDRQLVKLDAIRSGTIELSKHVQDLRFLRATCSAVSLFLALRLVLGLFGMDLYEIYWWFTLGLTIALCGLADAANRRTDRILGSDPTDLARHGLDPQLTAARGGSR